MKMQFRRTELLLGEQAMERLHAARVAVFGVGGVGGYVCEALVRAGVGRLDIIDNDTVGVTNLNRQIIALHSTLGRYKVDAMRTRLLDINPEAEIRTSRCFVLPETMDTLPFAEYDYIVDCIDTVTAKLALILRAQELGIPIICALGTGNKLDPSRLRIGDIYETSVCPLARVMRKECRKRGVRKLKVLWSDEEPLPLLAPAEPEQPAQQPEGAELKPKGRRDIPGSTPFVPGAGGLLIASQVVRDILGKL